MTDATIIPIRPAATPGYTDTAALNDLHALLTTATADNPGELLGDVAAILARTGRALIAARDIEIATAETAFGRPVALIRSAETTITIRQEPAGPGLLVTIAPDTADYLRAAAQQAGKRPDGRVASWLAAVESEIRTNAGSHTEALRAVDRAREKLANPGLIADLPWFDYYDSTGLSGFAGYALLGDKQFDGSRAALVDAAGHMPRAAVKQKAVFLADIATVELAGGNLDEACASAGDAADQLRRAGYAVGLGRLREFRRAVEPWASSTPVKALDEQLAVL